MSYKNNIKIISLLVVIMMISSSVFSQTPINFSSITINPKANSFENIKVLKGFSVPENIGSIQHFRLPKQETQKLPTFIHIQDAHTNAPIQRKISHLLKYVKDTYNINTFAFEGAHKKIDPNVLKITENKNNNLVIANYLLEKGLITGGELFVLEQSGSSTEINVSGIEDLDRYKDNIKLFRKALKEKVDVKKELKQVDLKIAKLKTNFYNPQLLKYDQLYQTFQNRKSMNAPYFYKKTLKEAEERLALDFENPLIQLDYPNLYRMYFLINESEEYSAETFSEELENLRALLRDEKHALLNLNALIHELITMNLIDPKLSAHYKTWREMFEQLHTYVVKSSNGWDSFPSILRVLKNLILKEEIEGTAFFNEFDQLVYRLERNMAKSNDEEELIHAEREFHLLKRVLFLEASRSDLDHVRSRSENIIDSLGVSVEGLDLDFFEYFNETKSSLLQQYRLALEFYDGAEQREISFVDNLVHLSHRHKTSAIAFVTGGYHTKGIQEEMKRRGLGFISIAPQVYQTGTEGDQYLSEIYEEVLLGRVQESRKPVESYIVPELFMAEGYQSDLGAWDRNRVKWMMEAFVKVGIHEAITDLVKNSDSRLDLQSLAHTLQLELRKNDLFMGEEIQVLPILDSEGVALLRISWKSFRPGVQFSVGNLLELDSALENQQSVKEDVLMARSLGGTLKGYLPRFKFTLSSLKMVMLLGLVSFALSACHHGGDSGSSGTAAGLPQIAVSQPAVVDSSTTLFPRQLRTSFAEVTGGSNIETTVFFDSQNSVIWHYKHTAQPTNPNNNFDYSGVTITKDNKDDNGVIANKTAEDFMDISSFSEIVFNIEKISGDLPNEFKVQFVDEMGITFSKSFSITQFDGSKATLRVPLSSVNLILTRILEISLISSQNTSVSGSFEGDLRVTFQGVNSLRRITAQNSVPTAMTTSLSSVVVVSSNPRIPEIKTLGGSVPGTTVQRIGANKVKLIFKTENGEFSGLQITTNNNDTPQPTDPEDFMNFNNLNGLFRMNVQFASGSIPSSIIVELKDRAGEVYKTLAQQVAANNHVFEILLDPATIPTGFDLAQVLELNLVLSDDQTMTGEVIVEIQGFAASSETSIGASFPALSTTSFAALGNIDPTQNADFTKTGNSSSGTSLTQNAQNPEQLTLNFATDSTNTESGFILTPTQPNTFFVLGDQLDINLLRTTTDVPQQFIIRFTDNSGAIAESLLFQGVENQNVGLSIFSGANSPLAALDRDKIVQVELLSTQVTGDANPHQSTLVLELGGVTARSLGTLLNSEKTSFNRSLVLSTSLALGSVLPTYESLSKRIEGFSIAIMRTLIEELVDLKASAQSQEDTGNFESNVQTEVNLLQKASTLLTDLKWGVGLQIEVIEDTPLSESDIQSILANLKVHPELFVRLIYTGSDVTQVQSVVDRIQSQMDGVQKVIGDRFDVIVLTNISQKELKKYLKYKLMNQVYRGIMQHGIKLPNRLLGLMNHTVFLGASERIEGLGYGDSVRIYNDLTSEKQVNYDSDLAFVRVLSGRIAVLSFSELSPEQKASINLNSRDSYASNFLSEQIQKWAQEWKNYVQGVLTSA